MHAAQSCACQKREPMSSLGALLQRFGNPRRGLPESGLRGGGVTIGSPHLEAGGHPTHADEVRKERRNRGTNQLKRRQQNGEPDGRNPEREPLSDTLVQRRAETTQGR